MLPQEFTVVAAGGYAGRLTDFQIDQSGHQATQIDVAVHHPDKPVVLMLGAYEPNIWNIGWSPQTRIVAIVVSGYHRQAVAGLDKSVPVLNSSHDNKGACGYFYISSERNEKLNPLSQRLFGRTVDMVYPAANGKVLIGNSLPEDVRLITSSHTPAQSYYDKTAPLAGQAGLDDAVSRGVLRPATAADARRWAEAVARKNGTSLPPVAGARDSLADASHLFRTYVIAKPFVFPAVCMAHIQPPFSCLREFLRRVAIRGIQVSAISTRFFLIVEIHFFAFVLSPLATMNCVFHFWLDRTRSIEVSL